MTLGTLYWIGVAIAMVSLILSITSFDDFKVMHILPLIVCSMFSWLVIIVVAMEYKIFSKIWNSTLIKKER